MARERSRERSREKRRKGVVTSSIRRSFGFVPDLSMSPFANSVNLHANSLSTSSSTSPLIPSNMAFHDLTPNGTAPPNAQILLGLGSKFICTPPTTTGALDRTFKRFERDFYIKVIYSGEEEDPSDENLPIDRGRSKLYVNSKWCPTAGDVPYWCSQRLSKFFVRVQKLFRRRPATSNLFPHQLELLDSLSEHPDFLFPETDKGLGPCCVTYDQYVQDALIHLKTEEVYQQLSETEASNIIATLDNSISTWLARYKSRIGRMAVQYIDNHRTENSTSPFGQFYILYKRHKKQRKDGTWPTRPVCSDVTIACLTHSGNG